MAQSRSEAGASRPASGLVSPQHRIRSRTHSISSDRPSTVGYGFMSPPISVSPEAAFIAASAASQIVTNDHDSHANTWYDEHGIEPSGETAIVSNAALQLVNNFLDQLLFNILAISRSTSLAALRPAVTEVLKPKLAKDAINQADEELREYLGGGDDDDMLQSQRPGSPKDWDIELIWKRTRLRCMVYSSLGDLEEEDEDFYMEQEHLDVVLDPTTETVSPAVSIFLTSILEFMGEQALISASQAAYHRMRFIYEKAHKDPASPLPAPIADRVTVEEVDMERVAFDRTIGRLWRSWKKRIRSPTVDAHHSPPGQYTDGAGRPSIHVRQYSLNSAEVVSVTKLDPGLVDAKSSKETDITPRQLSQEDVEIEARHNQDHEAHESRNSMAPQSEMATAYLTNEEWLSAAINVPLPIDERDIAEILIPGLAHYDDEEGGVDGAEASSSKKRNGGKVKDRRPKSLMIPPSALTAGLPTPTTSEPRTPEFPSRKRANSLPTPTTSPYSSPRTKRVKAVESQSQPATEEVEQSQEAADENEGETPVSADSKQKRSRLVPPLVTTVIGAAITTVSPRAIPMASMVVEDLSDIGDDADEELEGFTEEPQILTSSRISISGRSNSPTTSDYGRPLSICPVLPPGSPSLHSPRVIEVTGPRSPVSRSRGSSIDAQDPVSLSRASDLSRASSISTQPIAEEGHDLNEIAAALRASYISTKVTRAYKSESISEAEEVFAEMPKGSQHTKTTSTPFVGVPSRPTEASQSPSRAVEPVRDSAARPGTYSPPVSSPLHPTPLPPLESGAPTKVTILGSNELSGSFYIHDTQDGPFEQPLEKLEPAPVSPPERSSRREVAKASAVTASTATSASAGAVATSTTSAASSIQQSRSGRETQPVPNTAERSLPSIGREPDTRVDTRSETRARSQAQAGAQVQAQAQAQPQTIAKVQPQGRSQPSAQTQAAAPQQSYTTETSTSPVGSKLKPIRTSEESTAVRPEDVARNFEQLIQSDQTIQYTLTPENMRDMDASRSSHEGSSSILAKSRRSEETRQVGDRSRSSSAATNKQADIRRSPSISRGNANEARSLETAPNGRPSGPVPRLPHNLSASVSTASLKSRANAPQARDARVPRESLADFAEFIRATGPPSDERPSATLRRGNGGAGGGLVSSVPRNVSSPAAMGRSSLSRKPSTAGSTNRSRFQARGATVDYKDDNSDLIDFIRRGPPETAENPRIPRTVAPFRSPMDSDQMSGAAGGRAVDATISSLRYSAASTSVTESSVGSSAGLLRNKAAPATGAGFNNSSRSEPPDAMPKRKTRRVKDPYAIDLSDDDEEEFYASVGRGPKPAVKEESLLDFLNSVPPPPPEPQRRPAQKQAPKKKASTSSLMSRFMWGSSNSGSTGSRGLFSSSGGGDGASFMSSRSEARSLSSRAGSAIMGRGHVPIQVHMPSSVDKYGTTTVVSSTSVGMSNSNSNSNSNNSNSNISNSLGGSSGRVARKKFEPREAQNVPSQATQDLAEFFRNSGPAQSFRG